MLIEMISVVLAMILSAISTFATAVIGKRVETSNNNSEKIIYELKRVGEDEVGSVARNPRLGRNYDDKLEKLIQSHHEQALEQSRIQFWFSLGAAVVGFVFIICTVFFSKSAEWYEYIVKALPGGIIEIVSVLFFSQSRETRERASDFLNRLREDRQYEKSIAIADTIQDEKLKSLLKAEIAMRLCGIDNIDIISKQYGELQNGNIQPE